MRSGAEEQTDGNLQNRDASTSEVEPIAEHEACTEAIDGEAGADTAAADEPTEIEATHEVEAAKPPERSLQDLVSEATNEHNAFLQQLVGIASDPEASDTSNAKRQLPQLHRMRRLNGKQHRTALHIDPSELEPGQNLREHECKRNECVPELEQPHSKRKKPGGQLQADVG